MNRPDMKRDGQSLKTFYNGDCPVCRAEMTHYQDRTADKGEAFEWCDVAADPDEAASIGLDWHSGLRRLHVIDRDGTLRVGFDAVVLVWEEMDGYRWLGRVFRLPVIFPVSAWIYEHIVAASLYRWALRRRKRADAALPTHGRR